MSADCTGPHRSGQPGDPIAGPRNGNSAMSRYERKVYFERLVAMRLTYAQHPDDDHGVLLIEDAIAYVEAVLTAVDLEERLEMEIIVDAAATSVRARPAAAGGDEGPDQKRAERIARLTR